MPDLDLLEPAIYVMAALTIFTTFQRVFHVRTAAPAGGGRSRRGVTATGLPGSSPGGLLRGRPFPRETLQEDFPQ